MPSKLPLRRLRDIAENSQLTFSYTERLDFEAFKRNKLIRDAVERCLSRISEAASKLGSFAEERLPGHEWLSIRDLGNIFRHQYERVDAEVVWKILSLRLPRLIRDIQAFLTRYPDDQETL